ncbi:hypothetical protein BGZ81_000882 [Podila clonocystis]|nr:hypothetical protein BGZ81_000882 [Podila clonocystis]
MNRPNPLEIPEILSLVAYFVPAWERPQYYHLFIPRDLLSCALVSKSWREAMLPHLWAVYSTYHMAKIPLDVISRYSIYFRHFDQVRELIYFSAMPPLHWQDPASEQPLFRPTALKSFVLTSTSTSSPEQLDLLRTNPGIVSLQLLDLKPSEVTVPLLNMFLPLAETLKELTLSYTRYTEPQAPFALLGIFPNLERLHIDASQFGQYDQLPSKPSLAAFQASAPAGSVQLMSLKQLTMTGIFSRSITVPFMEQIMSRSPNIKHLVMCLPEHVGNHHVNEVREQVIEWNTVYRAWIQLLDSDAPPNASPAYSTGPSRESMPNDAHRGLERLDISNTTSSFGKYTWIRSQYERGCQDLVGVSAKFLRDELALLVPLLQHWKHTVQQVDLELGAYLGSRTVFSVLSQVLGSLPSLRSLRFVAEGGLAKEDSFAIFRDNLGRQNYQGDDELETMVATTENICPAWACQDLESLVIKGLWGTMSKDRLGKGQSAVTLEAASEGHHWAAYGSTKFGKQFRVVVSDRIKTLPALRRLILNKTAFDYVERCQ